MSRPRAGTILGWVREDLDKQLRHLGAQLEHLASVPSVGKEAVLDVAASLDDLRLTLGLLELPGAAMLAEEMMEACRHIGEHRVGNRQVAYAALLDAVVVLPAYFDRLQSGHRDMPMLLLPAINRLRNAHRARELQEASLFTPDLEVEIPELDLGEADSAASEPLSECAPRLRQQFESGMMAWLDEPKGDGVLTPLQGVCETLVHRLDRPDLRRTWWIALETLGALADDRLTNDKVMRRLMARLHLNLKALSEGGEAAVEAQSARSLAQALLYQAALAKPGHRGLDRLRKRFDLLKMIPDQESLIQAQGSISGKDRDMFESMGAAIGDEFALIKEALDLTGREGIFDPGRHAQSVESMQRIRDSFAMLGLTAMVESAENLLPIIEFAGEAEGEQLEQILGSLAEELLLLESSVRGQIESLGEPLEGDEHQGFTDLPAHEFNGIVRHLLDEAMRSIQQFEDGIKSRLGGNHEADVSSDIAQVAGALDLLGAAEAAELAGRVAEVTGLVLANAYSESSLPAKQLEWFTDAVAALELLVAELRDGQGQYGRLLKILEDRLDWVVNRPPEESADTPEEPRATPAAPSRPKPAASPAEPPARAAQATQPPAAVVDAELLEVFLEEYDEVLEALQVNLPSWLNKLDDVGHLSEVRRAFHTLKGSSRMVGAFELGDFCWQIENLLNALLDSRIDAFSDAAVTVRLAHATLPALKQRLMGQETGFDQGVIDTISAHAESLAGGAEANWASLRQQLPGILVNMLPEPSPVSELVADSVDDGDEVLEARCAEIREHLAVLESLLESVSSKRDFLATTEHIHAAHTLGGALAIDPEGREAEVARALEALLQSQRNTRTPFDQDSLWILASCLAHLQVRLEQLGGNGDAVSTEDEANLIRQLDRIRARFSQPEAHVPPESPEAPSAAEPGAAPEEPPTPAPEAPPASPEDDITGIFLDEAQDVLGRFDSLLNTWRDNLTAMPLVQSLQREIHTFKGGARMAGLEALGDLSHGMEDLLERTARHELPPMVASVQILEQGCDRLLEWVGQVAQGSVPQAGSAVEELRAQVDALVREPETRAVPEISPAPAPPKVFTDLPEIEARAGSASDDQPGQGQIRVDAERLDGFIKAAGEVNIYRSRLERQVEAVRSNLVEFNETLDRLREQFRKLEIETEAQIHSRYPDIADAADKEFDPLELDRFSSMQQLSRSLSESVADLLNIEDLLEDSARQADTLLNQQARVSTELQEGLMQTLMVPFGSIAPRLRRLVRKAAQETGKHARLKLLMAGTSDQVDRNVLEHITAPLEHMLRNAVAHGIEKPAQRKKLGKDPEGEISIRVEAEATEFVIRVEDDGAGINSEAIRQSAIERGLIDEATHTPPQQLFELILASGFSTSSTVTGLAGRGVGMDVVSNEVKQIGGSLEIASEEGQGSCFTIRIPFNLAVMQAIGVMAGEQRYLIPLSSVVGVARLQPDQYRALLEGEEAVYEYAGQSYPVLELEPLLGEPVRPLSADSVSLLIIQAGDQGAALRVPELLSHREVVIKPVGPQITSVPGILGGTVTGDGRVIIILDPGPIIRQALLHGVRPVVTDRQTDRRARRKVGMVVDDSITMRKINSRVLKGQDMDVMTAKDGEDAVEQLKDRIPDILLLDIEMPRMDGYQLAEYVRGDARLRHIPIVMITSRSGEKHRERARQAGANAYLTKPYKEAELISTVEQLLADQED